MARHCVGSTQDFEPQKVKVLRVGGERICLALHEGKFYAFEDRCTHDDGPLCDGPLIGCELECVVSMAGRKRRDQSDEVAAVDLRTGPGVEELTSDQA